MNLNKPLLDPSDSTGGAHPLVGVSACLLGHAVRYDGGHKRDRFLTERLACCVEFLPVCPETAIGLGTPRPPIQLVGDPERPLVILSHAPLTPIFRPWGQWTADSGPLLNQLSRFRKVICLHGHVHQPGGVWGAGLAGKYSPGGLQHISLPATSWPLPSALAGTPRKLRPGLGPRGCGWAVLDLQKRAPQLHKVTWQA